MPIERTVIQGETTIGLADRYGHFAKTVWEDPANAELKRKRTDMNVLMPGDVLVIPDLRPKSVSKAPEARHRFRRKGIPAKFRLQVFDVEKPRANQEFRLSVDGVTQTGISDAQGVVDVFIAPNARRGLLVIGDDNFTLEIDFGHLEPISELTGVQQRLENLGFSCGGVTGALNDGTRAALRAFQDRFDLTVNGEPDQPTRDKLVALHDAAKDFPPEQ